MTVDVAWADRRVELRTAIFGVNGTLTVKGQLLPGVAQRLQKLRGELDILLVSSDTYGTLDTIADELRLPARRAANAAEKAAILAGVGASTCAAVGNGENDLLLLRDAALGLAVIGPEGCSPRLFVTADIVCASATDAIDLLLDPRRVTATLRP
jgi:soluble P-type ATPase